MLSDILKLKIIATLNMRIKSKALKSKSYPLSAAVKSDLKNSIMERQDQATTNMII